MGRSRSTSARRLVTLRHPGSTSLSTASFERPRIAESRRGRRGREGRNRVAVGDERYVQHPGGLAPSGDATRAASSWTRLDWSPSFAEEDGVGDAGGAGVRTAAWWRGRRPPGGHPRPRWPARHRHLRRCHVSPYAFSTMADMGGPFQYGSIHRSHSSRNRRAGLRQCPRTRKRATSDRPSAPRSISRSVRRFSMSMVPGRWNTASDVRRSRPCGTSPRRCVARALSLEGCVAGQRELGASVGR